MLIAHVGGLLILFVAPIPVGFSLLISVLIVGSLIWCGRTQIAITQGYWRLTEEGDLHHSVSSGTTVSYRVIEARLWVIGVMLALQATGRQRVRMLIMRDAVLPETFRKLCTWIRQRRLPVQDTPIA